MNIEHINFLEDLSNILQKHNISLKLNKMENNINIFEFSNKNINDDCLLIFNKKHISANDIKDHINPLKDK